MIQTTTIEIIHFDSDSSHKPNASKDFVIPILIPVANQTCPKALNTAQILIKKKPNIM